MDFFRVYRHDNAHSVNLIPLGRGSLFRCEATCNGCGWTHVVDAGSYREVLYEPLGSIHGILAATNPDRPARAARSLNLAHAVRAGSLTPAQRRELAASVFRAAVEYASTEGTSQVSSFGAQAGIRFVFLPILLAGVLLAVSAVLDLPEETAPCVLLGLLALVFGGLMWSYWTASDRFAKHVLRPLLVRGLMPLAPSADEIATEARRHKRSLKTYRRAIVGLAEAVGAT